MACEFICDGCGKRESVTAYRGTWFKPVQWFQRADGDGAQIACSRECIDKVSQATGKTAVVAPF